MGTTLDDILPSLNVFLQELEPLAKDFPVCCDDSSIVLHAWLRKNGLPSKIMAGYYPDPVKKKGEIVSTPHFWVMVDDCILDGTAVQFSLDSYDECPLSCSQIRGLIGKTKFAYAVNSKKYRECVNAYMPPELELIIEILARSSADNFSCFMKDVKAFLQANEAAYSDAKKYFSYTSLYKLDHTYYNTSYLDNIMNLLNAGLTEVQYMRQYY